MSIIRVEAVEVGEVCCIYSYPSHQSMYSHLAEIEQNLVRLSSPGKWQSLADKNKVYEFLSANGTIVWLRGDIRVQIVR